MIKSKKLFARALYAVMALALVAGLTLVPAIAADTPADTDVGFEFGAAAPNTAEWSTAEADKTGAMGAYSVKLDFTNATTYVGFAPAAGTTVADLIAHADDDEFGFWYYMLGTGGAAGFGPQLELQFTNAAGDTTIDFTLMLQDEDNGSALVRNAWTKANLGTAFPAVNVYGGVNTVNNNYTTVAAALADAELVLSGTWELTRVRVQLYPAAPVVARSGYVDDVAIDGTTYELEPIFLDAEFYSIGDTVEVTVPNFAANADSYRINPVAAETGTNWMVSVTSSSDPTTEITVALGETGANTGVFTASFGTSGTPPVAANELYVEDGATITVTYTDSDPWWGTDVSSGTPTITALVDDTAPVIIVVSPADGATTEDATPVIKATYSDATANIDNDSVEMLVNGVDVTDDATVIGASVTYTPTEDLVDGTYDVTVNVSDNAGNAATEASWSFRIVSWLEGSPVSDTSVAELDALDTVGVAVSVTGDASTDITVGRYASNPEPDAPPTFSLIENGFFDVKVTDAAAATQIVIKFADANITAETIAYVWGETEGEWLECTDQGYNAVAEYLWVKVRSTTTPNISELTGTPFAISGEPVGFDPMVYDVNDDDVISKTEALAAVADYFDSEISKAEALEVIALYFV